METKKSFLFVSCLHNLQMWIGLDTDPGSRHSSSSPTTTVLNSQVAQHPEPDLAG
uniref:Uncharacterized protein n=1 Tax=Tetraselmis sp. GSL018 TaxID=582737 RepID=A0A061RLG8_9CHLO